MVLMRILGGSLIECPDAKFVCEARCHAAEALCVESDRVELVSGTNTLKDEDALGDTITELQVIVLPDPLEVEVLKAAKVASWESLREKCAAEKTLDLSSDQGATMRDHRAMQLCGAIQTMLRLPKRIGRDLADSLEELNADGNMLEELPDNFTKLVNLKILSLAENQLESLPRDFGRLNALRELELRRNKIQELPASVAECVHLRRLSICGNKVQELPDIFRSMPHLVRLDVSSNQLTELPDSVVVCAELKQLFAARNRLVLLPDQIGNLSDLVQLEVAGNRLTALPDSVAQLVNLSDLDLNDNNITALPEGFQQLEKLRYFQVSIESIPPVQRHAFVSRLPPTVRSRKEFQESGFTKVRRMSSVVATGLVSGGRRLTRKSTTSMPTAD